MREVGVSLVQRLERRRQTSLKCLITTLVHHIEHRLVALRRTLTNLDVCLCALHNRVVSIASTLGANLSHKVPDDAHAAVHARQLIVHLAI